VSLLESERRRKNAVEDSSERVPKRIQDASAKVFPVTVICHGCNLERIYPNANPYPRFIIHVTSPST
jgi:hypothetical protein